MTDVIALTGLIKIELPSGTIRYCEGGFIVENGETYRDEDAIFGTIGAVQALSEGVGDNVPSMVMTLLPPNGTAIADISQPGNQTARVTFSIAEYDPDTNNVLDSDVHFLGQVDQTIFTLGKNRRELTMSVVSIGERLFEGDIGNNLGSMFHKSVHPNEKGHDNATGLGRPVAWGVESAKGGYDGGGGGGGRGGGWRDPWVTPKHR